MDYLTFFGFAKKPFDQDLKPADVMATEQVSQWRAKCQFVASHKLVGVLTGDVGAGKSTAVRWAIESLPFPEYRVIFITAGSGSIMETYRKILLAVGITVNGNRTKMHHAVISSLKDIISQKVTPLLVVDEASLLSLEAFRELHTLAQIDCDAKAMLSLILVGQDDLIDKLIYPTSRPLASRVGARMHLEPGNEQETAEYIGHHLKLAGVRPTLFEEAALTATHQASGGTFRFINNISRGALITAAAQKRQVVIADDVRTAATELFLHQ
jgi:type II secretory pathway predicted ATPase ExeA